jgi:patatin-like phospholipase/acyl hydrolase
MSRMPERTPSGEGSAPRVRKILCLDGGGVRGLSSIMILRYIMYLLSTDRGVDIEPWQEFDMICGTSTGGRVTFSLNYGSADASQTCGTYAWSNANVYQ